MADPQTPKRWREILYFHQHPEEHPDSDFCCDSGEESEVVLYAAQLEAENAALRKRLAAYEKIMEESKIDTQGFDAETLAEIRHTNRPPMSERSAGE